MSEIGVLIEKQRGVTSFISKLNPCQVEFSLEHVLSIREHLCSKRLFFT